MPEHEHAAHNPRHVCASPAASRRVLRRAFCALWLACCCAPPARPFSDRYILELRTQPTAAHAAGKDAAAGAQRRKIEAEQHRVRGLLGRGTKVVSSAGTIGNLLVVEGGDPRQLAALPGVAKVHRARSFRRASDRAVAVNRVVDAWNQVGLERGGAGVKIAIIDSGIDANHPAFRNSQLAVPPSFPKVNQAGDTAHTNNKIVVARSYVHLLRNSDPDMSARDRSGHGTAVAMVAAGERVAGPLATIAGVAPQAQLGNYKIFGSPGHNDLTTEEAVLKAIDDAVADGMDIINLSIGDDFAPRPEDDLEVQAIERATRAGVIVVVTAGNNGNDPNTIASPATAPSAIAVGASRNDRVFGASVVAAGVGTFSATPGSNSASPSGTAAALAAVAALDGTGTACSPLPASSLEGRLALILRGGCSFQVKLTHARRAGAVGAIVYTEDDSTGPFIMDAGTQRLPGVMIAHSGGTALARRLAAGGAVTATVRTANGAVPDDATRMASFSAAGPSSGMAIKPDLVAVGSSLYLATQSLDPAGDMYDASGFTVRDGTSFAAPLVAGAAALLKSARPGLTVEQYRSLLINSAAALNGPAGGPAAVQQAGAGLLDAAAALRATAAVSPASLSFGTGTAGTALRATLTIANLGSAADTFSVAVEPLGGEVGPSLETGTVSLAAGASAAVPVAWATAGLGGGTHEGYLRITSAANGTVARVPYWYAVPTGTAARITVLESTGGAAANTLLQEAIMFRITDVSGVPVLDAKPRVTVTEGRARIQAVASYDRDIPGLYGVSATLGTGTNRFRIQTGTLVVEVSIYGER